MRKTGKKSGMAADESHKKKGDRRSQETRAEKFQFAPLMDVCHVKNSELELRHQKYTCRVVLRGDIVKNESGVYAVFIEQGSSASQMTPAKVMDVVSIVP